MQIFYFSIKIKCLYGLTKIHPLKNVDSYTSDICGQFSLANAPKVSLVSKSEKAPSSRKERATEF
jgi:hypothetical protein